MKKKNSHCCCVARTVIACNLLNSAALLFLAIELNSCFCWWAALPSTIRQLRRHIPSRGWEVDWTHKKKSKKFDIPPHRTESQCSRRLKAKPVEFQFNWPTLKSFQVWKREISKHRTHHDLNTIIDVFYTVFRFFSRLLLFLLYFPLAQCCSGEGKKLLSQHSCTIFLHNFSAVFPS